jgi:hypothetical protein
LNPIIFMQDVSKSPKPHIFRLSFHPVPVGCSQAWKHGVHLLGVFQTVIKVIGVFFRALTAKELNVPAFPSVTSSCTWA